MNTEQRNTINVIISMLKALSGGDAESQPATEPVQGGEAPQKHATFPGGKRQGM